MIEKAPLVCKPNSYEITYCAVQNNSDHDYYTKGKGYEQIITDNKKSDEYNQALAGAANKGYEQARQQAFREVREYLRYKLQFESETVHFSNPFWSDAQIIHPKDIRELIDSLAENKVPHPWESGQMPEVTP